MNFEQEIHNQNNARRMNILKGFSDFSEDLLQKSEDGSELEKGHMDFSNQRVYVDNSVNRKLNRVGQKYGGRNVEDEKGVDKKDNSEEEKNENKPTPPQETQPNEQGQYSTEQLTEFASQAEDWQLQEFLDNAKKSGDNSEYMQAQVNIAETELNRRRGGESQENSEEEDEELTSKFETGEEVDTEDGAGFISDVYANKDGLFIEVSYDSGKVKHYTESELEDAIKLANAETKSSGEDYGEISDFVKDEMKAREFLNKNPEIKSKVVDLMMEDFSLSVSDALKLYDAKNSSGNEALQTVEEAKNMLDELHAKLGGNNSNDLDYEDSEDAITQLKREDEAMMIKTLMDGNSFFEKFYEISESDLDWENYISDISNYISDNDLGLDDKNQERDFDNLPKEQKAKLSKMMNDAYEKFKTDRDELEDMPEYFGKKVTRVSP